MRLSELGLLGSVLLWAFCHPLQVEYRDLFLRRLGANAYYSLRYSVNIVWFGGNCALTALLFPTSAVLWQGSTEASCAASAATITFFVVLLLIPGSPVAVNSKIAHSRHDDNVTKPLHVLNQ